MTTHHPYTHWTHARYRQAGRLAVVEAPTEDVLDLDDLKLHLRIDHDDEDTYLMELAQAAVDEIDTPRGWLGRSLAKRTLRLTLDDLPPSKIYLPGPPIISVESVEYRNLDDELITIDASEYESDLLAEPGLIWPKRDGFWLRDSWPNDIKGGPDTFRVEYVAGYESADDVPMLVRQWLRMRVGEMYRDREGTIIGTIQTQLTHFERALDNLRVR